MGRAEGITGEVRALAAAGSTARPVALANARLLPVHPDVARLFPEGGLRRGATIRVASASICGSGEAWGATSLTLSLLAAASSAGSWCGVVTVPDLGVLAALEAGLDLARMALVPEVPPAQWPVTVGALVDAVDVVVVAPPRHLRAGDARRLSARARERGAVLVVLARHGQGWAEVPDLSLTVTGTRWYGLDQGHGHLLGRRLEVVVSGRRAAARPRQVVCWLPDSLHTLAGYPALAEADVETAEADAEAPWVGFAGEAG